MIYNDLEIDKSIYIYSVFITLDFSIALSVQPVCPVTFFSLGICDITLLHSLHSKLGGKKPHINYQVSYFFFSFFFFIMESQSRSDKVKALETSSNIHLTSCYPFLIRQLKILNTLKSVTSLLNALQSQLKKND